MPRSLEADYRPWHAAGYEGWVDRALFDRLDASCRADPGKLLELPGARVVRGARVSTAWRT